VKPTPVASPRASKRDGDDVTKRRHAIALCHCVR
jgi:hypothetical protein